MTDMKVMLAHLSIPVQKVLQYVEKKGKSNLTHVCVCVRVCVSHSLRDLVLLSLLSEKGDTCFTLSSTNLFDILFCCHTIWLLGFSSHFLLLSKVDDHEGVFFFLRGLQCRAISYAEDLQQNLQILALC